MKVKVPEGSKTGKEYMEWLNSLPHEVFCYYLNHEIGKIPTNTKFLELLEAEFKEYFD